MEYVLKGRKWHVCIELKDNGAYIKEGVFGNINIIQSELFTVSLKDITSNEKYSMPSSLGWDSIKLEMYEKRLSLIFYSCCITVKVNAISDDLGISWTADIENRSDALSVMGMTYPTPYMQAERFDFFAPVSSGMVVPNAGNNPDFDKIINQPSYVYPSGVMSMQYFAVYRDNLGIYIGFHDEYANSKEFEIKHEEEKIKVDSFFHGIGASLAANSFKLAGYSRWQMLFGDWYDASMIYASFVRKKACWIPKIDENGRLDTAMRYKDIPFWINDYIPNSPLQGDNKPMSLSSVKDTADKDNWINTPIKLKNELGTPIAYHVYNWHEIPFNINYPHFIPAKDEYIKGSAKLRNNGIYVIPYINTISWEMLDGEDGYTVNFENTGIHSAVIDENGEIYYVKYPQKKMKNSSPSMLAPICPSKTWEDIIYDVSEQIALTTSSDGIYFDQIAAHGAHPCFAKDHAHLPGGGNYWVSGYNKMMSRIRADKPADAYHFTECHAEPYMKSFDGYLTWTWVRDCQVPAFPAVYLGYIGMIGRMLDGTKKDDIMYFRHQIAQSFLYGQQLGWCKSDALYNEKKIEYLKIIVPIRYRYACLFRAATLCRPPKVTTSKKPVIASPALWYKKNITLEQVLAGAFRYADGHSTVLFLLNISETESDFFLEFDKAEYKIKKMPSDFKVKENIATISGKLGPLEIRIWEL